MAILGYLLCLASLVCWIIVLIAAFQDEVWKGVVGLLCGLYLIYYGLVEFQHEKKWLIVLTAIFGGAIGGALIGMGGGGPGLPVPR